MSDAGPTGTTTGATPAANPAPVAAPAATQSAAPATTPAAPVPPAPAPPVAAPPTPAEPAAQPAAKPAKTPAAAPSNGQGTSAPANADDPNPAWLPERLEQAKQTAVNKLLGTHGLETPEALQQKLARLDELETALLSDAEKTQKLIDELKPQAARTTKVEALLKQMVDQQFAKLPEQAQTAIDATANGDPEQRLALMQVLQAAGSVVQPATPVVPIPEAQPAAPVAIPAQTAPNAPPPPAPSEPETAYQVWKVKVERNDPTASIYFQMNRMAIENSRPQ